MPCYCGIVKPACYAVRADFVLLLPTDLLYKDPSEPGQGRGDGRGGDEIGEVGEGGGRERGEERRDKTRGMERGEGKGGRGREVKRRGGKTKEEEKSFEDGRGEGKSGDEEREWKRDKERRGRISVSLCQKTGFPLIICAG